LKGLFLEHSFNAEQGHGRLEQRHCKATSITPVEIGLPSAQSVSLIRREWVEIRKRNLDNLKSSNFVINSHDRYFITSLPVAEFKETALKIRWHWSVENKNHYKKDVSYWLEDDHRHRKVNAAQNLALMRSALLALIPFNEEQNINDCFHTYDKSPRLAIKLIQSALPI